MPVSLIFLSVPVSCASVEPAPRITAASIESGSLTRLLDSALLEFLRLLRQARRTRARSIPSRYRRSPSRMIRARRRGSCSPARRRPPRSQRALSVSAGTCRADQGGSGGSAGQPNVREPCHQESTVQGRRQRSGVARKGAAVARARLALPRPSQLSAGQSGMRAAGGARSRGPLPRQGNASLVNRGATRPHLEPAAGA